MGGHALGCISLVYENSILLIRVQGYRGLKETLKTVKTVHSEYFRGVVFCESFGIYCAANHGILCSGGQPLRKEVGVIHKCIYEKKVDKVCSVQLSASLYIKKKNRLSPYTHSFLSRFKK